MYRCFLVKNVWERLRLFRIIFQLRKQNSWYSSRPKYVIRVTNEMKRVTDLRCVNVNFEKFVRTTILQNICERLLLKIMFIRIQLYNNWHNLLKIDLLTHHKLYFLYYFHQKILKKKTTNASSLARLVLFSQETRSLHITVYRELEKHYKNWNKKVGPLSFPLRISSVNVTKSLIENFIFCAVSVLFIGIILRIGLIMKEHYDFTGASNKGNNFLNIWSSLTLNVDQETMLK